MRQTSQLRYGLLWGLDVCRQVRESRLWLADQQEGDISLEGKPKSEWEGWLDRMQRKVEEQKELQEASEEASQTANEEPEVAGGSESAYNMV